MYVKAELNFISNFVNAVDKPVDPNLLGNFLFINWAICICAERINLQKKNKEIFTSTFSPR